MHNLKLDGNNIAIDYAFTPGTPGLIEDGSESVASETAMVDIIEVKLNGVAIDIASFDLSVLEYIVYEFHMHNESKNNDAQLPLFDVEMLEEPKTETNEHTLSVWPIDYQWGPLVITYKTHGGDVIDIVKLADADGDFNLDLTVEQTAELNYCYAHAVKVVLSKPDEDKDEVFRVAFEGARELYYKTTMAESMK